VRGEVRGFVVDSKSRSFFVLKKKLRLNNLEFVIFAPVDDSVWANL
jgi:hypothetical protein